MFAKCPRKMLSCFFFSALLTNISMAAHSPNTCAGPGRPCFSTEKDLLSLLGLPEDVSDPQIIQMLDISGPRRLFVMSFVRYRKISSAVPKLMQIVNGDKANVFEKVAAAEALCDFGNREWIPTIKKLSIDPNSIFARARLQVAGLLARAGDYSQFEIVTGAIGDSRKYVRFAGICEVADFRHKTDPVTDLAVELLLSVATTDPEFGLRRMAIYSLEKIAKEKPQVIPNLIDALETNKDSPDKYLGITCRVKLKIYGPKRNEEENSRRK